MYFAFGSADELPARAIIAAIIGDEALVPPTVVHSPWTWTATPVAGSATAEMSAMVRMPQCVSCCHAGFFVHAEQPEPAPRQAVSVQPRAALLDFLSVVPP